MNVEVRGESVVITGYVNAVERYSKPITSTWRGSLKTFVEKIKAGVFKTALKRNGNVKVLLNHNFERELANTQDGTAKLEEDNIGLRAEVTITDAEVVEKARNKKLVGWSFGFLANADEAGRDGEVETRTLTDLDLVEVSILDDSRRPAYNGTSIESRSEGGAVMEIREEAFEEKNEETTEMREEGIEIDALAEVVAKKVAETMRTIIAEVRENKAEDPAEENTEETAEDATETEADEQTEVETVEAEEETESRSIDYSAFEQRIAELK